MVLHLNILTTEAKILLYINFIYWQPFWILPLPATRGVCQHVAGGFWKSNVLPYQHAKFQKDVTKCTIPTCSSSANIFLCKVLIISLIGKCLWTIKNYKFLLKHCFDCLTSLSQSLIDVNISHMYTLKALMGNHKWICLNWTINLPADGARHEIWIVIWAVHFHLLCSLFWDCLYLTGTQ